MDGNEVTKKEEKASISALNNSSKGDYSQSSSSGVGSQSSSNGNYSQSSSNGYCSLSLSTGNYSKSSSTGHYSQSSSNGNYSQSSSTGDGSQSSSSGVGSQSSSNGYCSQSSSTGINSKSSSNGDYSQSSSNGNYSQSSSTGDGSQSSSNGDYSKSSSAKESSAASALGYRAMVKGDLGNLIMASEYAKRGDKVIPIGGRADLVDGKTLKPNRWYIVEGGKWVEVDYSDKIFGYVLSNKGGIKKIRTDGKEILYVVSDENGNTAHGETIKAAREDLVYKNVAKFEGDLPNKATGKEWIGIYRALTGACAPGIKMFVKSNKIDLEKNYTARKVAKIIRGQYGAEEFEEKVK